MNMLEEYRQALLFMEMGLPGDAARLLAPIVTAEPANAEARLRLALAYYASAQLNRAQAELRVLIERDPTDHYSHHLLGRTLERLNRPTEALPHLRLAAAMAQVPEYGTAADRVAATVGRTRR
ncbi:tetratricopeptide repeat protein [Phytohabitans sp. ZYX-F-186]|uniref:Tetratricopeptide repeat protein n=1 Tax=Phytohabitans maris TaxID=3071409 RepID=A0ABU0ZMD3_9ACTN|nr:tetratricopeptide repeat protein [Phytohabitans sp. ZYX-F-186]MDQ7908201.1 tetratricopeptide repeat protein [Phytohabitans sp. ZYX-F-186]